ncbi:hypothetical protein ACIBG0_18210 [Nocardia sp. NPDC050630]|uniref:hypothetical protein n=1 Tax=Nocardia sp. NPDC050630 TaxID=3364321 RepID=UPI0037A27E2A
MVAATSRSSAQLIAGGMLLAHRRHRSDPSTLSLIRKAFIDARECGLAMGIWVAVASAT